MVKLRERNRSNLTCFGWYWSVLSAGREPLYCISLCCTWFSQKTVFKFPSLVAVQRSDMRSGDLSGAAPTGPRGRRVSWVWQLLLTQLLLTVRTAATLPFTGESSSSDDDDDEDDDEEIFLLFSQFYASRCVYALLRLRPDTKFVAQKPIKKSGHTPLTHCRPLTGWLVNRWADLKGNLPPRVLCACFLLRQVRLNKKKKHTNEFKSSGLNPVWG